MVAADDDAEGRFDQDDRVDARRLDATAHDRDVDEPVRDFGTTPRDFARFYLKSRIATAGCAQDRRQHIVARRWRVGDRYLTGFAAGDAANLVPRTARRG